MTTTGTRGRLSVQDWLEAGFSLLAEAGRPALTIDRLCAQLGVTKGSFYWHFTGMAGYRSALIEAWAQQRGRELPIHRAGPDHPPRERLSMMTEALLHPRHWKLERAMREWARTDPAVAASVTAGDRRARKAVRQAFLDLGFEAAEADLRAQLTFAAGMGFLQMANNSAHPMPVAQRERVLDFMTRP
ncbi:TetR/AcrR family transcriptional regulator [Mycolicibacterium fallax]|uniref:TetR family transcriptional regulator n=1 Tax=Mycolicibacterium fallax TaxID=1793 RepID=A0A1X1R8A2_MYCFA|nr:TetR/AcrR family transcriptional regulator [Mycolicibacterium fallax]ORV01183.1 TetR family transcriptional regulator [Mycolicibacterium fallax]BBY98226.1 TetR family transcriptional regulator [Mycolicibacterium fallax]HSA40656.1 TetR/AcrR family transcriptional regulator [Mycobacterium sp.]